MMGLKGVTKHVVIYYIHTAVHGPRAPWWSDSHVHVFRSYEHFRKLIVDQHHAIHTNSTK